MIDQSKLSNVQQKAWKITAACPACQSEGHDSGGNHLVIYPDGRYACIARPGDSEHSRKIKRLVGSSGPSGDYRLSIQPFRIPGSYVVIKIR